MMMNMKVFGSIFILSFVLLATVSAQNETTTTVAAPTPTTAAAAATTTTAVAAAATTTTSVAAAIVPTTTTTAPIVLATTTTTSSPASTAATTVPPTTPNPCDPNPCLNGGICQAMGAGYKCTCADQFLGTYCQTPADDQVTPTQSRVDVKAKLIMKFDDDLEDITKGKGKALAESFCKAVDEDLKSKNKNYRGCKVTGFSEGSVIVEYYLVLNTSSEAEAANIANAVTDAIKSGNIGNYTTDPQYTPDVYIVRKVKASDVSPASDPTATTVSTALLIILGVALFILLVIIIILIVLVVFLLKLKEKREK